MCPLQSRFYIGVDPSVTSTGVVIIGQNETYVHRIQPGKRRGPECLDYIVTHLEMALSNSALSDTWEELPSSEVLGAVEGPALGATSRADDLGQVRGVVLLTLYRHGIPSLMVAPTSLKKFATGHGQAKKDKMVESAVAELNRDLNDDEADAYWLSRVAQAYHDTSGPLTRTQRKIMYGIRNPKTLKRSPMFTRDISV